MFHAWAGQEQMGHYAMSRTLTPLHYGETREEPRRCIALLKAWTLWRSRLQGWSEATPERRAAALAIAEEVRQHVVAESGELLGHPAANRLLRKWAPDVVSAVSGAP